LELKETHHTIYCISIYVHASLTRWTSRGIYVLNVGSSFLRNETVKTTNKIFVGNPNLFTSRVKLLVVNVIWDLTPTDEGTDMNAGVTDGLPMRLLINTYTKSVSV
jgi:hypothetical protein